MNKPKNDDFTLDAGDSLDKLARAFDFMPEDLEANRAGYMTERQRRQLHDKAVHLLGDSNSYMWAAGGGALVMLGIFLVLLLGMGDEGLGGVSFVLSFGALAVGIPAALFFYEARKMHITQQSAKLDTEKGDVSAFSGRVQLDIATENKGQTIRYKVRVGGETFIVPQNAFYTLHSDEPYTLYVAPHCRVIVAAEALEEVFAPA